MDDALRCLPKCPPEVRNEECGPSPIILAQLFLLLILVYFEGYYYIIIR